MAVVMVAYLIIQIISVLQDDKWKRNKCVIVEENKRERERNDKCKRNKRVIV